jgi:hypothetical protein
MRERVSERRDCEGERGEIERERQKVMRITDNERLVIPSKFLSSAEGSNHARVVLEILIYVTVSWISDALFQFTSAMWLHTQSKRRQTDKQIDVLGCQCACDSHELELPPARFDLRALDRTLFYDEEAVPCLPLPQDKIPLVIVRYLKCTGQPTDLLVCQGF